MDMIEPNIIALLWFALFGVVASLGVYVLAGFFPLETRPEVSRLPGVLLIAANCVLLLLVLAGATRYGLSELRWTSMVIVTGFALLFSPSLFNIWPSRWRDGIAGLVILVAALGVTTGLLNLVAPA